jgi:alanine dehydrogenase
MPGAVPKTSTYALNNATLPFTLALADKGAKQALLDDPYFLGGLNVCDGVVTEEHVAAALDYPYLPPAEVLVRTVE